MPVAGADEVAEEEDEVAEEEDEVAEEAASQEVAEGSAVGELPVEAASRVVPADELVEAASRAVPADELVGAASRVVPADELVEAASRVVPVAWRQGRPGSSGEVCPRTRLSASKA
jgi:hypothetical protein